MSRTGLVQGESAASNLPTGLAYIAAVPSPTHPVSVTDASEPAVRPALTLLASWLLITAVPLVAPLPEAGVRIARLWHFVLFGAALLAIGLAGRMGSASGVADGPRSRTAAIAGEWWALFLAWLPLVAVPALYAELPFVATGLGGAEPRRPRCTTRS